MVTAEILLKMGACEEEVDRLAVHFPRGCEVNRENIRYCLGQELDFARSQRRVVSGVVQLL